MHKKSSEYTIKIPSATILTIQPNLVSILEQKSQAIHLNRIDEIEFFNLVESDKHRELNKEFGSYKDNITTVKQKVKIRRSIRDDDFQINEENHHYCSIEEKEIIEPVNLEKCQYTFLTQGIGVRGREIENFYVNPGHINTCMRYGRNRAIVSWGTLAKTTFLNNTYEQCLETIVKLTKFKRDQAKKLLDDTKTIETFCPQMYLPIMVLGQGSFGIVLLVLKNIGNMVTTTMPYALKLQKLPPVDHKTYQKFKVVSSKEAYYYSILEHPNILRMFDHFQYKDWRLQRFEYLPYGDLTTFTYKRIKLAKENSFVEYTIMKFIEEFHSDKVIIIKEFLKYYTAQILMALEYLHALGIVHFDLKPDNIAIGYRGYIKVFDFGLSYDFAEGQACKNENLNVMMYGCREKKESVIRPTVIRTSTDIYAFSIMFFEFFANLNGNLGLDKSSFVVNPKNYEGYEYRLGTAGFKKLLERENKEQEARAVPNFVQRIYRELTNHDYILNKIFDELRFTSCSQVLYQLIDDLQKELREMRARIPTSYDFSKFHNLIEEINKTINKVEKEILAKDREILSLVRSRLDFVRNSGHMVEVFISSYSYHNCNDRKTATQLLELKFYDDIVKKNLFMQKYSLEEIINFDLQDIFVFNYKSSQTKYERHIKDLGKMFDNIDQWDQLLIENK